MERLDTLMETQGDMIPKKFTLPSRKSLRANLITKDSFVDDFACHRIKKGLTQTLREGKEVKAAALAKSKSGQKKKDDKV